MKAVAILGTGPAGLMAAQAAALHGVPFSIFGLPDAKGHAVKSKIGGAQYVHTAVPTVSDENHPDMAIVYRKVGTSEGYQAKVYGDEPVPFVSWDRMVFDEPIPAWSLHDIYDRLWNGICGSDGHSINLQRITPTQVLEWLEMEVFGLIISTIPRPQLCMGQVPQSQSTRLHHFTSQTIQICGEPMGAGMNEIIYNGSDEQSWYRTSNMSGRVSTEWGHRKPPGYLKTYPLVKPIHNDCDCWSGQPVVFAGRYGEWRKGVLVHEAFTKAFLAIEGMNK